MFRKEGLDHAARGVQRRLAAQGLGKEEMTIIDAATEVDKHHATLPVAHEVVQRVEKQGRQIKVAIAWCDGGQDVRVVGEIVEDGGLGHIESV